MPAGKLVEGETPRQAAIRKALEEVGIYNVEGNLQQITQIYVRRYDADVIIYRFLIIFPSRPKIVLNCAEHSSVQWMDIMEALNLPNITGAVMGLKYI